MLYFTLCAEYKVTCNLYFCNYSAGFEILEDCGNVDVIVSAVGGGGMLSGIAAAVKLSSHQNCRLYGVEPEGGKYLEGGLSLSSFVIITGISL